MTDRSRLLKTLLSAPERPFVFWGLLVLATLPVLLKQIQDVDVWWHIVFGGEYLRTFDLPRFGDMFFTPFETGFPKYLRFTFLGDVLLYLTYFFGGDVALQLLMIAVVLSSIFLLLRLAQRGYGWGLLLLSIAFVIGTYQKQLIRNSLFGMLLVVVLFCLVHAICFQGRRKLLLAVPLLLGLWSCIHGSYLIGFALFVAFVAGEVLDDILHSRVGLKKLAALALTVIVSFACISIYNTQMSSYFFYRIFKQTVQTDLVSQDTNSIHLDRQEKLFPKIKRLLNNTVFRKIKQDFPSAEYASPFDKLKLLYVKVSFGFLLLGIVLLAFFIRPVRLSYLLPFGAVSLFGLGYLRGIGFIPIMVMFMVCSSLGMGWLQSSRFRIETILNRRTMAALAIGWALLAWGMSLTGNLVPLTGLAGHVFGWGRLVFYDQPMAEYVLRELPEENVFNSVDSGGYYLLRWHPQKKVFITGCFPVHGDDILAQYRQVIEKGDYGVLEGYGIRYAMLPHKQKGIIERFLTSRQWTPVAVSAGSLLMKRMESEQDLQREVLVLLGEGDLDFENKWIKNDIALSVFRVFGALINQERESEVRRLADSHPELIAFVRETAPHLHDRLEPYLPPQQ